jgi:hypothetical protein
VKKYITQCLYRCNGSECLDSCRNSCELSSYLHLALEALMGCGNAYSIFVNLQHTMDQWHRLYGDCTKRAVKKCGNYVFLFLGVNLPKSGHSCLLLFDVKGRRQMLYDPSRALFVLPDFKSFGDWFSKNHLFEPEGFAETVDIDLDHGLQAIFEAPPAGDVVYTGRCTTVTLLVACCCLTKAYPSEGVGPGIEI